jgi:hypothetical protein
MRIPRLAAMAAVLTLAAPAAIAAPTCQNRFGDTARCETAGAMPVGWTLSTRERLAVEMSRPQAPVLTDFFGLACVLAAFFALIALMPDFDGVGWDAQESDEEKRG